jgi:hypothetical protein
MERMTSKEYNEKLGSMFKVKRNKFNAKKTIIGEKKFDSMSEGNLYCEYKLQEKAGLIKAVETQVKEELFAYGVHICNYYVDFLITHNDDSLEYVEHKSKGTVQPSWRIKYKMLEAKYKNDKNVKISTNWYRGYKIINQ